MGWPCHLFLFYQALADFTSGVWESNAPGPAEDAPGREMIHGEWTRRESLRRGFAEADLPPVAEIIQKARNADGGLTLYACSASVRIMGLDPGEVRGKVDEIVGLPTMLQIAESSRFAWYI
jgi:peroxiredoxin family protein